MPHRIHDSSDAAGKARATKGDADVVEAFPGMRVLQRIRLNGAPDAAALFRPDHKGITPLAEGGVRVAPGRALVLDTYFGAFFEATWRGRTRLSDLRLRLRLEGEAILRLVRRRADGSETVLHDAAATGTAGGWVEVTVPAPPGALHPDGRVFASLRAGEGGAVLRGGAWVTPEAGEAVGLVPVFCTFNREADLARVLRTLASDAMAIAAVTRVVVVNQGRRGLADHPEFRALPAAMRERLHVVEQANLGGAGGFTRGLLEARRVPGATHAALMDDDVAMEPEALSRMAAFFSLATEDVMLGGQMLDLYRPTELYEAGAWVEPRTLYLRPLLNGLDLRARGGLDRLNDPPAMDYNGWWMLGLPLRLLDRHGLPLPCFIRGDDVEFGRRLALAGVPTVGIPGVAIWHEPFYVKLDGWQLYYDLRNILAIAAVQMPRPARAVAALFLKRLLLHLLTHRYYGAALVMRAVEDYLRGPACFARPGETHASLDAARAAHPPGTASRARFVPRARVPREPVGRAAFAWRLALGVLRNLLRPTRAEGRAGRVGVGDFLWFRVGGLDEIVVDGATREMPRYRRCRATFRRMLGEGLRLARRVLREGDSAAAAWREAHPALTSEAAWRDYLDLPRSEAREEERAAA